MSRAFRKCYAPAKNDHIPHRYSSRNDPSRCLIDACRYRS
ncbi:hypothetical protein C6380_08555 [Pseudomonas syringae pv. actinidiae]|nr:hypothetical protein D9N00_03870 [Pseudomonas syringae pv. actinidiae]AYL84304.1 hypothetical protein CN228_28885 [Pseudomonas syringae pv. actinidiae str. Shaanxi_M228]MBL3832592.1 hypothetical protein [Pseudomonas syringae pv. theae]MBL3836779.1 hypothetical protein [Pseudomonas syringae pv. theae]MBL3869066.1 hypothetical protein [Pseudomonas syringae pv. theae]